MSCKLIPKETKQVPGLGQAVKDKEMFYSRRKRKMMPRKINKKQRDGISTRFIFTPPFEPMTYALNLSWHNHVTCYNPKSDIPHASLRSMFIETATTISKIRRAKGEAVGYGDRYAFLKTARVMPPESVMLQYTLRKQT